MNEKYMCIGMIYLRIWFVHQDSFSVLEDHKAFKSFPHHSASWRNFSSLYFKQKTKQMNKLF